MSGGGSKNSKNNNNTNQNQAKVLTPSPNGSNNNQNSGSNISDRSNLSHSSSLFRQASGQNKLIIRNQQTDSKLRKLYNPFFTNQVPQPNQGTYNGANAINQPSMPQAHPFSTNSSYSQGSNQNQGNTYTSKFQAGYGQGQINPGQSGVYGAGRNMNQPNQGYSMQQQQQQQSYFQMYNYQQNPQQWPSYQPGQVNQDAPGYGVPPPSFNDPRVGQQGAQYSQPPGYVQNAGAALGNDLFSNQDFINQQNGSNNPPRINATTASQQDRFEQPREGFKSELVLDGLNLFTDPDTEANKQQDRLHSSGNHPKNNRDTGGTSGYPKSADHAQERRRSDAVMQFSREHLENFRGLGLADQVTASQLQGLSGFGVLRDTQYKTQSELQKNTKKLMGSSIVVQNVVSKSNIQPATGGYPEGIDDDKYAMVDSVLVQEAQGGDEGVDGVISEKDNESAYTATAGKYNVKLSDVEGLEFILDEKDEDDGNFFLDDDEDDYEELEDGEEEVESDQDGQADLA